MSEKKIDVSALGQSIDSTFGRSSTPKTASYSVKITLAGPDALKVMYSAVVNFGTEREMIMMKRRYAEEARSIVSQVLKHVKSTYKELTGDSISMSESDPVDSLEVVSFNVHNPKRTCVYRSKTMVEVS